MGHHSESEPVIYEADIVIIVVSLTYKTCSTLFLGGTKKYTFFLKYNVVLQWMRVFHLCTTLNISAKQSVVLCNFVKKWKKITVGKKTRYVLKIPSSMQCTEYVCLGAAWLLFHKGLRTCKQVFIGQRRILHAWTVLVVFSTSPKIEHSSSEAAMQPEAYPNRNSYFIACFAHSCIPNNQNKKWLGANWILWRGIFIKFKVLTLQISQVQYLHEISPDKDRDLDFQISCWLLLQCFKWESATF